MSLWANILEAIMENMLVFFTLISYGNIKVLLTGTGLDNKNGGQKGQARGMFSDFLRKFLGIDWDS